MMMMMMIMMMLGAMMVEAMMIRFGVFQGNGEDDDDFSVVWVILCNDR